MSDDPQQNVTKLVDAFLTDHSFTPEAQHACPYLSDKTASNEGFSVRRLPFEVYLALMDRGFRRSGETVYRPACPACRMCRQIRVPVAGFTPTRSQRRVVRQNRDLAVSIARNPCPSKEKWAIFRAYLDDQHDDTMSGEYEEFNHFLYNSPTETIEISYTLGEQLLGVSIVDLGTAAMSSVYMFFDPRHKRRSLGTFSVLWEIDHCRRSGIPYYYLGYYVAGSKTMAYKARYTPHEILEDDHTWRRIDG